MIQSQEELFEFKLNALLELTELINSSFDEKQLYEIYQQKLEQLVDLESMALYVFKDKWRVKVKFGQEQQLNKKDHNFLEFHDLTYLEEEKFKNWPFDLIFPVNYKGTRVAFVLLKFRNPSKDTTQISYIRSLTNIVIIALQNKLYQEQRFLQHDLEMELSIASDVQSLLVPRDLPRTRNIQMNSTYIPHRMIGGDYFDYIEESDENFLICIADVSGKGVPAALLMSNFQATLRALVRHHIGLEDIVKELNSTIFQITEGERFITAFLARFNKKTQKLTYINAGHNPPFYLDRHKKVEEKLRTGTTLLGVFDELPFLKVGEIDVVDYSMLFMYTDGLVEIFDDYGAEFGEVGLEFFLRTEDTHSLEELHEELLDLILSYSTAGYQDDITILSCKFRH